MTKGHGKIRSTNKLMTRQVINIIETESRFFDTRPLAGENN